MKFYFFDKDDRFLFTRDDAEEFQQYCRELTVEAVFPASDAHPVAETMRVAWKDDDDAWEVYEIDEAGPSATDGSVQITGVHLALAELRDDRVRSIELDDVSMASAVDQILAGTAWTRGTIRGDTGQAADVDQYTVNGNAVYLRSGPGMSYKAIDVRRKGDIMTLIEQTTASWYKVEAPDGRVGWMFSRYLTYSGSGQGPATSVTVSLEETKRFTQWELLEMIAKQAELLLWPRVEIPENGGPWVRAIDMHTLSPEYRGVRLTLDTNVREAFVHYKTDALYTAMLGVGANELTFADVPWSVAGGDPADKPAGQDYVADPDALAAYGRNGRHRLGLAEFDDVKDAAELLRRTWDALQRQRAPQVTIDGEIADLYKLGYGGKSMRLYDAVQVILDPPGIRMAAHILDLQRDLVRPEHTKPVIGTSLGDDIVSSLQAVSGGVSSLAGSMSSSGASIAAQLAALDARVTALEEREGEPDELET